MWAPILAFLAASIASFSAFISKLIVDKGFILLIIGFVSVATIAVFASIIAIVNSVTVVMPEYVQQGFNMITPSNFWPCVSLVIGARLVRWGWVWKVHFLEMFAR